MQLTSFDKIIDIIHTTHIRDHAQGRSMQRVCLGGGVKNQGSIGAEPQWGPGAKLVSP